MGTLQDADFSTYDTRSPKPGVGTVAALDALRTTSIFSDVSRTFNLGHLGILYLHRTLVHQHSVELGESVVGAAWLAEDNGSNTAAHTVRPICEHRLLDLANRFAEVFLQSEILY